ncbi:unnamed protein product (macronuclear) [Paramecium tetraurelia]|uniref:Tubulin-tyrosine ligase family protein n=1 Tax=Paramecium tetraurelia TaxID=5888 RepID=A0DJZ9_PARTE|nr:uncharacterized protein GSPATT00017710001 [Paramecium tetraurelia]CAK83366.1 unnamed protein product [Paramecium tetraurelia]|eukprot:XP_001450763.1 hypothetical protein (macronuclear) [Paramecium tetraurelia strain d4-2]
MNPSEESTTNVEIRKSRNKTQTKCKSQSPQVKPQFIQQQLQHKKSKTKERLQQNQESLPNVTKKLNPKSTSFSKKRNQFKPAPQEFCLKVNKQVQIKQYFVGWGNNEALVKRVMSKRTQWKETTDSSSMFVNLKWQQSERGYRYERLIVSQNYKQLVNHFEHHKEISNKSDLIKNLSQYCEKHKLNVFDYTPLTFVIDFSDENCDFNITQFLKTYEQFAPKKPTAKQMLDVKRRLRGNFTNAYQRDSSSQFQKIQMNNTFLSEDSPYMWLLKPTFLNRGRGIQIFDNLETLVKLVSDFQEGLKEKTLNQKDGSSGEEDPPKQVQSAQGTTKKDPNQYIRQQPSGPCIIKSHSFVIQKYIERPALINKRKFDIRVWGLVTHELDAYFFQEGYIRTSSEDFTYNIENTFVHLTNNAIQKYSKNYGEFEDGNQLSFKNYQDYLKSQNIACNVQDIINKMKERIWMVFNSVRSKINFEDRKYCFEIFGFDFILDSDQEVWLIEVNTNPCIEESSPLLKMYIPRMLDDAFKLTLDVLFPPQQPHKQSLPQISQLPQIKEESHSEYPVIGYPNDENMWMLLGSLNDRKVKKKK